MKALVCHGPRANAWPKMPGQMLAADADAIVRADKTTICGTDLHVLYVDVPGVTDGRIIGHEAVRAAGRPAPDRPMALGRSGRHDIPPGPSRPPGERNGEHHVDR